MTDFDDVTFREQFRFTKTEFLVILWNIQDKNGGHVVDETVRRLSRRCAICDLQILLEAFFSGLRFIMNRESES